jgi:hypothetical protein
MIDLKLKLKPITYYVSDGIFPGFCSSGKDNESPVKLTNLVISKGATD